MSITRGLVTFRGALLLEPLQGLKRPQTPHRIAASADGVETRSIEKPNSFDPAADDQEWGTLAGLTVVGALDPIGGGYATLHSKARTVTKQPANSNRLSRARRRRYARRSFLDSD